MGKFIGTKERHAAIDAKIIKTRRDGCNDLVELAAECGVVRERVQRVLADAGCSIPKKWPGDPERKGPTAVISAAMIRPKHVTKQMGHDFRGWCKQGNDAFVDAMREAHRYKECPLVIVRA